MDLNLYRVFVQVYESDTLVIASERLHISQSAVSHALGRLRQHFDDDLFIKEGRKLVATAFARRLYPQVKQAVNSLTMATEQSTIDTLIAQTKQITIAMNDEIELVLLPLLLQKFASHAPHIRLNSVRLEREKMNKQLRLGLVDVAIDVTRSTPDSLYQKPLLSDEFVVLSNANYQENEISEKQISDNNISSISMDTYLNAQHIVVSSRPTGKSVEDIRLAQLGYHRQIAVRCQHYNSAVRLLQQMSTPYMLTLPKLLAKSLHTDNLIECNVPIDIADLALHLYWHKEMDKDILNIWVRGQILA
ncbi:LysR family transcriptional regulator [Psychrobacter sp. HD31]|uniref:LysR substrate-binding domain-containing protein n=1 Tax=Psychrobacter sp. HD31 TaxID=3112003 RepID=UPI003DA594FE